MPAKKIIDAVGLDLQRDRQQHRHRRGRADAGQHAHRRADGAAEQAHSRLIGVPAVMKPCSSWFQDVHQQPRASRCREAGQVDRQQLGEHPEHRRGDGQADQRSRRASARRLRSSRPSADLKPRTASTKHSVQLRMKPMRRDQRRVGQHAGRDPDEAGPVAAARRPRAPPSARKPPLRASHTSKAPHSGSSAAHHPGQEVRADAARSRHRTRSASRPTAISSAPSASVAQRRPASPAARACTGCIRSSRT